VTAIGGAVGGALDDLRRWTLELLEEQIPYGGGEPRFTTLDCAAFGTRRFRGDLPPEIVENLLVVADLRLDNRAELSRRVGAESDASDQALLARAWQMAGENCLDWLVGDFAFAIFDRVSRTLYLARDPTGQRPLYYARTDAAILFASMPAAFRPIVGPLRADRVTVAKLAAQFPNTSEDSYFENIRRVRQGEVVAIAMDGRAKARTYWNPPFDPQSSAHRSELVDEFRHLLDTAVGARIAGRARPVATHLSSGFDSSSVTATAARLLNSPEAVVAFTSAPRSGERVPDRPGWFSDESAIAAQTAEMHGIRHVVVRDVPRVTEVIRNHGRLLQIPMTGAVNMAWWLEIRRQAAALGADCVLTAELGNQSLNLGGVQFMAELVRRRAWGTLVSQLSIGARRGSDSRFRAILMNAFGPWLPKFVTEALQRTFHGTSPFRDISFLRPEWQAAAEQSGEKSGRSRNIYQDTVNLVRGWDPGELRKAAIASYGIEEFDPMADRRLLEFALRLPPQQFYWNGVDRPLMREALEDRLPRAVFEARGRGMQGADWTSRLSREEALGLLEEMSASRTAQELFDLERMRGALERWPTADWNRSAHIQQFLTALIPSLTIGVFLAGLEEQPGR
jgi:asparagine synthase (glutamine-hydrolysing)